MAIYFDPRTGKYVQVTPGGQVTNLKMQTNVVTSQNPGQSGMSSGAGAPPPTATPVPSSGAGGAAGTGGGGTVNTQGGSISQGNIYGGTVTNSAGGGTGSLDASGGSNNVYRETAAPAAPAAPAGGAIPEDAPGAECGMETPCPEGKFCKMGVCEPIPDQPDGEVQSFQQFMSSRTNPGGGGPVPNTTPSEYWSLPANPEDRYSNTPPAWAVQGVQHQPGYHIYEDGTYAPR